MSSQLYRLPAPAPAAHPEETPQLCSITAAQYTEEWTDDLQSPSCAELFFITGGHGTFRTADTSYPVAVNDVILVNAGVPHTVVSQTANPLSLIVLGVERLKALEEETGCTMIHLAGQQSQLAVCLELLMQEAREQADGWAAVCQNLLEIFLRRLVRRRDFSLAAPDRTVSKTNRDCELVRRYIDNHFKENLRLDDLAALVKINKYYLSHTFQREFGTSPISYLISRRIQESRYLLSDTDHSLSQIAHILGFSSLSYFSQSFRRLEGISPMEYRRQCRNSAAQGGAT